MVRTPNILAWHQMSTRNGGQHRTTQLSQFVWHGIEIFACFLHLKKNVLSILRAWISHAMQQHRFGVGSPMLSHPQMLSCVLVPKQKSSVHGCSCLHVFCFGTAMCHNLHFLSISTVHLFIFWLWMCTRLAHNSGVVGVQIFHRMFFFASVLRSRLWRFWTCSTPLGFRPVRACQVLNCKVCKQILDLIAMELIFPFALTCMWIDWRTYPTLVTFTCITLVTQIGKFKQMHSVGIKLSYIAPVPASRRVFGPWIQNLKHVFKILTLSDLQFDDHTNDDPTTSTGQLRFWPNLIASKRLCTLQHGTHFFYTCFCTSKPLWNHLIGCYCNFMV